MMDIKNIYEYANNLKDLMSMHPNGIHFCATSKESGFTLNSEELIDFINAFEEMRTLLDYQNKMLDNLGMSAGVPKDLGPMFYHTGDYERDLKLYETHQGIKRFVKPE